MKNEIRHSPRLSASNFSLDNVLNASHVIKINACKSEAFASE